MKNLFLAILIIIGSFTTACDKNNELHLISLEEEKKLGAQVKAEIEANPTEYPILSETQYPEAYGHIRRITSSILNSGSVAYKSDFLWEVKIIKDDKVLNAFATPGGYIYVYTGLIKYLVSEDHLAGVMGHEIAHADRRHSIDQIEKVYGIQIVLSILGGGSQSQLAEIVKALAGKLTILKFGRDAESEADEFSVIYLKGTEYQCNGAAGFFEKLIASSSTGATPEFLSTHPNPDNRVAAINSKADELACSKTPSTRNYQLFKNSLPQ